MNGELALRWLDEAAQFSLPGEGVTRLFLTDEHRKLIDWLADKAKQINLRHHLDDSGNVTLKRCSADPGAPTLLIGSHQDSVRNGGKYDGMLGIVLPMLVLADMEPLPYNVEIIAFGDEEGTRFSSTLVGSSAIAGNFDKSILLREDNDGVSMQDAMEHFGLHINKIPQIARNKTEIMGFLELHVEQGPILEDENVPVGLVTSVTGIERHQVKVLGKAGHAGTVPMHMRQDALVVAADIVRFVNKICLETTDLVGVVGKMAIYPNSVNVIPAAVDLTIELRSPHDGVLTFVRNELASFLKGYKGVSSECIYQQKGFQCDAELSSVIAEAIQENGISLKKVFSGAGHDGLAMHFLTSCAMLFVRCKDGLSHHPDESVTAEDCTSAMNVLKTILLKLGTKG